MTVTSEQAMQEISSLLSRVEQGETVIVERDGRPIVRMQPTALETAPRRKRILGMLEGQGIIPDDIKTPYAQEIEEMFYGDHE